ncbi:hypothetical protein [Xenorhabdus bovienii]|uniref:hypothetical protein n=1 Tax=Xenorhabdus bovienii TaxID=40576 RepID=UPI0012D33A19|nr:hypothetical protein [Xenorhabdus bovienii]
MILRTSFSRSITCYRLATGAIHDNAHFILLLKHLQTIWSMLQQAFAPLSQGRYRTKQATFSTVFSARILKAMTGICLLAL